MFETPEQHEDAVRYYGKGKTVGHMIPCACCGQYFHTTDWPPAICRECREGPKSQPT